MPLPAPPSPFRGAFSRDPSRLGASARSSGPIRLTPAAVASPVDEEDVSLLVAWAAAEGVPLTPRGAGTGMPGGNVGRGVSLELEELDRLEVDPETARAWVGPGVVADRLDREAGEHGLFFPALPSSSDRCTVGGMVANNAAGARTFGYGAVRDWVEALDVVLADGSRVSLQRQGALPPALAHLHQLLEPARERLLEGWPRVRKNSSGYALDRFLSQADGPALLVGSEGTLGVITGIGLRLAPTPARRALVLLPLHALEELAPTAAAAESAGAAACEFLGRRFLQIAGLEDHPEVGGMATGAEALVLIELDDARVPLEEGLAALRRLAREAGVPLLEARDAERREELWKIRHAASPVIARRAERGQVSMQFIEDSVVPRERVAAYLRGLEAILEEEETDAVMFGHAGDGNVHVNPLVEVERDDWRARVRRILDATAELVASLGGTLTGEHGDGRIRAPYLSRVWGPDRSGAFAGVKEALDPAGILNPGVIVPLPGQDPLAGISPDPRRR